MLGFVLGVIGYGYKVRARVRDKVRVQLPLCVKSVQNLVVTRLAQPIEAMLLWVIS